MINRGRTVEELKKITAHPVFLTTDTRKSEKGILCVIPRKNTDSGVCSWKGGGDTEHLIQQRD